MCIGFGSGREFVVVVFEQRVKFVNVFTVADMDFALHPLMRLSFLEERRSTHQ